MLLEFDSGSSDNSIEVTIKEWQRASYQRDKITTFTCFCCSCSRFFDIQLGLLGILKIISRIEK